MLLCCWGQVPGRAAASRARLGRLEGAARPGALRFHRVALWDTPLPVCVCWVWLAVQMILVFSSSVCSCLSLCWPFFADTPSPWRPRLHLPSPGLLLETKFSVRKFCWHFLWEYMRFTVRIRENRHVCTEPFFLRRVCLLYSACVWPVDCAFIRPVCGGVCSGSCLPVIHLGFPSVAQAVS